MAATNLPNAAKAPTTAPPIGQDPRAAVRELAPWPQIDRTPIIIGAGVSLQYLASAFRTALVGYRQQQSDVLAELLEKDPHLFSVVSKIVFAIACGRLELTPPELPAGASKEETKAAQEVCDFVSHHVQSIPELGTHIGGLAWGTYYGMSSRETHWERSEREWAPTRLSKIHTRRLSYPDYRAWDLYIWDQGSVLSAYGTAPTNGMYGLRVADYPGKFIVHVPEIRDDYPTRDGLGRILASWSILKLIASRGGGRYLERFATPWPDCEYNTDEEGQPRKATGEDIADARIAMQSLGLGSLASWVHPNSVKLTLRTADEGGKSGKLSYKEWVDICNAEMSKGALGGTLTTEVGSTGGNRSLGEVQESGELRAMKYYAGTLADSLRRDLGATLLRLNRPQDLKYLPTFTIHVEPQPDPSLLISRGKDAAASGIAVDADELGKRAGLPVLSRDNKEGRRMLPLNPIDLQEADPDFAEQHLELAKKRMEAMPPPEMGSAPGQPGAKPGQPGEAGKPPAKTDPNDTSDKGKEEKP